MSEFNPAAFMSARAGGLAVSEADTDGFDPFRVHRLAANDPALLPMMAAMSSTAYHHLPSDIQACAMTSYDNRRLNLRWRTVPGALEKYRKGISKIMQVYGVSHSSAETALRFGTVDLATVERLYSARFPDPESSRTAVRQKQRRSR